MAAADISESGVLQAMAEYDRIGERAFFDKYGFEAASKYWIIKDGRSYASKAIANVAQAIGMNRPYARDIRLAGGEATVVGRLRTLGFQIQDRRRNPAWNRDELILALDLYRTNPVSPPGKESAAVAMLSDLLNKMRRLTGETTSDTFRNANGVYMKMMNLRALDPAFTAQGKVGMKAGGALERVVWAEYQGQWDALAIDAEAIRSAVINADEANTIGQPSGEPYEGEEGGVIMRLHKRYERDPKLVWEKRKAAALAGTLACEVCSFDFAQAYGELGAGYIEVHHTKPIHTLTQGTKTKLTDLALLCANCHRMAHRKREPLSIEAIRRSAKNIRG
ncbi:HNH endonuclease [Sphingomonas sp. DC1100-1]|uniref:HNH endonuclease n=1 Tax=unclassified Sphingomonas TaxID=196159 RepID=UPI003CF91BE1